MEKISGILPATARITTVDLRNSGTARPGMPSFGRQMGQSTVAKREADMAAAVAAKKAELEAAALSFSELPTTLKAGQIHRENIAVRDTTSDPKAAIVKQMTDSFFMNKANRPEPVIEIKHNEASDMLVEIPQDLSMGTTTSSDGDVVQLASPEDSRYDLEAPQEDSGETLVVGQHLDVRA